MNPPQDNAIKPAAVSLSPVRALLLPVVMMLAISPVMAEEEEAAADPAPVAANPADSPDLPASAEDPPGPVTESQEDPVPFDPAAYREFGFDFLRALVAMEGYSAGEDRNVFISPLSLGLVLEALWYGAGGTTAQQIAKAMHHPSPEAAPVVNETTGAVCRRSGAVGAGEKLVLDIASSVWLNDGIVVKQPYATTLKVRFRCDSAICDFGLPDKAAEQINKWVAHRTAGNISQLVGPGDFSENTFLAVTNAVHFKGEWLTRFDPEKTKDGEFTLTSGRKVRVPMMTLKAPFALAEKDGLKILELPYFEQKASMFLLLPREGKGELEKLEASLNDESFCEFEKICDATGQSELPAVDIRIPRFTVTDTPDTVAVLRGLGVSDAFDEAKADFSGMSDEEDLFLSAFKHQARIEVNEAGSEAAAATAAVASVRSSKPTPRFFANRPFLYLIRDNTSGSILFLGRMANPDPKPEPPVQTTARPGA